MNKPSFTIVTVTFNAAKVLETTLKSVASQDYENIQYLIMDGASKDETVQLAKSYQLQIPNMTICSEPDKGLYDAMNKAIAKATGDYICFLNAGDAFKEKDTLSRMVDTLPEIIPDVIYGETEIVDGQGNFLRMRRLNTPEVLNWKSFKQGMVVCHQAFFARTALVPHYDMQYRFSADFDWCIRVMKQSKTLHNTHLTLVKYLQEGLTTQNHKASLKERFRIMAHHYGWFSAVAQHLWFVIRAVLKS
ncbi:MAG: glycosyltransferase [Bacteroidales bacterium]|nr:glycosyltransferase [Candidatus Minthousia equi]